MKPGPEALAATHTATASEESPARTSELAEATPPARATDEVPALVLQVCNPERYRVLGEQGRGARGCVSRARDSQLGREIAIKELLTRGRMNEARFVREALITARLEHPGIVPVYEAGRWPDGTPFYAMKLVAGLSLRDLLAERQTIEDRIVLLHHVIAVADAIAYAHGRNIIHRDLKPANVVIGEFGETVVIDWGLAKDLTADDELSTGDGPLEIAGDDDLTATGSVLGTPAYMPPEQRRGEPVDQRADVFAIGAMLWELCASQRTPPASAGQRRRILRRVGIDRDLASIIHKAVDPDPARRYPDAGALASDLKAFKAGARIAARHYSPWAMFVHWTLRHRAIAASVAAAIALAITGGIVYVRNITSERDRADQERDHARISEASAVLERDPTRAKELLGSLTVRTPQSALLMSRARQRSAVRVVAGLAGVAGLYGAPGTPELALLTVDGELYRVDPRSGDRRLIDRDVGAAVIHRAGDWLYGRKPFGARAVTLATPSKPRAFDAGELTGIANLVSLRDAIYALDTSNDLYRLSDGPPVRLRRGVRQIAGDGSSLLVCAQDGTLEALRDGAVVLRRRCPQSLSPATMAVAGDDYVARTDAGILVASRGGRVVEVPTPSSEEYELALSSSGVVAFVDYDHDGSAWFLRANSSALERGPAHVMPMSVAAGGRFAAWGYTDGTVIAVDTTRGAVWELEGHPDPVTYLVIDEARNTLVSASNQELRVWDLTAPPATGVGQTGCRGMSVAASPDATQAAVACADGSAWVWSRAAGTRVQLHQHAGRAIDVSWLEGRVCSGGWDGKVLCSTIDGKTTRTFDPGAGRINGLIGSPGGGFLVFATGDGRIWKLDDDLHPLYSQGAVSNQIAISSDGKRLASSGLDGSLVVFDLVANRVVSRVNAHRGAVVSVAWSADGLLTSGIDGVLRQWSPGDRLEPRGEVREAAPIRFTRAAGDVRAYSIDRGILAIDRAGAGLLRLELGKPIHAIEVSSDTRYIAVTLSGEVLVVDLEGNRLATLPVASPDVARIGFLDAGSLAIVSTAGYRIVRMDELDYLDWAAPRRG